MKSITKRISCGYFAVLMLVLSAAACQSAPPVQEMSDARQAVAVAIQAGAGESAAALLRTAEDFLASAQRNLSARAYDAARRDALQAKTKALEALALAEQQQPQ